MHSDTVIHYTAVNVRIRALLQKTKWQWADVSDAGIVLNVVVNIG